MRPARFEVGQSATYRCTTPRSTACCLLAARIVDSRSSGASLGFGAKRTSRPRLYRSKLIEISGRLIRFCTRCLELEGIESYTRG
jgi:hypothetical protein